MRARNSVAALVGAFTVLALAPPAHATFPGNNGKIAYDTDRDGNFEIYSMNPDGTSKTRLTNNAARDVSPAWSADGTKIAFVSNRDGNFEIYKMNADGTGQTRLTTNTAYEDQPSWSPDGTKIIFVSGRDGNNEIYTMNADGTAQTRITNNAASDVSPAWAPDGTKLAFESNRDGNNEIYKMNPDGTSQTNLTNNAANDELPKWTPISTYILFDSSRTGIFDIYRMNSDGTNVLQQISLAAADTWAAPEPIYNGNYFSLAWQSDKDGPDTDIFWGYPGAFTDLTLDNATDGGPDWQAANRTYARPKAATPLRVSLVPAYKQCNPVLAPASHRGSISAPSCYEPTPESKYLTVGTADFNGQAPNWVSYVLFKTITGDTSIDVSTTDIRCQGTSGGCSNGALADYTDDLRFDATFRITDKGNGPVTTGPSVNGTVTDIPLRFNVPCTTTGDTTIGSTCSTSTTVNALLGPTAIVAGRRAIWQLNGDVKLYDGGADGVATTTGDNTLFATGGLFIP
jgi:Tol biopolymer transport system component